MSEKNWDCIWKGTHIDVLHSDDGNNLQVVGIYNLITKEICEKCGNPYRLKIQDGYFCLESYLHERLIYADGVFQVGHYYNKESFQTKDQNDLMNSHIWGLKRDSDFAIPLSKAMFITIKNHFPILLDIDNIIPMPNYIEESSNMKAVALAKELEKLYNADGRKAKLIEPLQKVKNVKVRNLPHRDDREEAVKDMYRFDGTKSVEKKKILLVDDVLTAGNNKGECTRILRQRGAEKIWVLVAGRTR